MEISSTNVGDNANSKYTINISVSLEKFLNEELNKENSQLANDIKKEISETGTTSQSMLIKILKMHINDIEEQQVTNKCQQENGQSTIIKIADDEKVENSRSQIKTELNNGTPPLCNGQQQSNVAEAPQNGNNDFQKDSTSGRVTTKLKHSLYNLKQKFDESKHPFVNYLKKMRGGSKSPPFEPRTESLLSFITSFIGIGTICAIEHYTLINTTNSLVIGSFGATAVLVFSAIKSPLAQPRNVICGHLIAALIGPTMQILFGSQLPWLAAGLAVSLTMAVMSLSNTVHPPAGATAIIAVYSTKIHSVGYFYVIMPVGVGVVFLILIAVITNNLFPCRKYPQYWF